MCVHWRHCGRAGCIEGRVERRDTECLNMTIESAILTNTGPGSQQGGGGGLHPSVQAGRGSGLWKAIVTVPSSELLLLLLLLLPVVGHV
jgi:hypothetical protein